MAAASSIIAGVAVAAAAGVSYASAQSARRDAKEQWNYSMAQNSTAMYADAEATRRAAEAEAGAIMGQANAEASAYMGQAEIERRLLYAQAEESRGIAYQNIEKMKMEADESLRRLEGEQNAWEAKARAKAAASGVRNEGSTALSLTALDEENNRQYSWLDKSYNTGLAVARNTAEMEYGVTRRQGDAAAEAGKIRANAALAAGGAVSGSVMQSGYYFAEALRKKGDAYLAPVNNKASQAKAQALVDYQANYGTFEYGH